jgi:tetratricopeptide (TPR) repeat protein
MEALACSIVFLAFTGDKIDEHQLRMVLVPDPYEDVDHRTLANVQLALGDHEAALRSLAKAIELNANDGKAYFNRAYLLYNLERYPAALKDIDAAITITPYSADQPESPYWLKGSILLHMGKYDESILCHRLALKLNNQCKQSALELGVAYALSGRFEAGGRIALAASARWPDDSAVAHWALLLLAEAGHVEPAAALAEKVLKAEEYDADVLCVIANVRCQQKRYQDALELLKKAQKVEHVPN